MSGDAGLVFHLIPHVHWDREWYRTEPSFRPHLVAMLDDLIPRLEDQGRDGLPTFHLDGQTILLEDYLSARPGMRERVEALVRTGRLVTGPWYVLADEQIPAAHALRWNLALGQEDQRRLGASGGVCYSPDAFGHPAVLPDLATVTGLCHAVVWRGVAGERDLFRWQGPEGGELLVYHLPPSGYEVGMALPANPVDLARAWPPIREVLVSRATTRHVAVFVGADHHRVHPALPELARGLAALEPGGEVVISSIAGYFEAVEREVARDAIPILQGSLREGGHTWLLQGTLGTRSHLKRRNAELELALERVVEPWIARATRAGGTDRTDLLHQLWRKLLRCHFHDTLCGCCTDGVARAMAQRLDDVAEMATSVVRLSVEEVTGFDPDRACEHPDQVRPTLVCWNPGSRLDPGSMLTAMVTLPGPRIGVGPGSDPGPDSRPADSPGPPFVLRDPESHRVIPVQVLDRRWTVERIDAHRHYPLARHAERIRVAFRGPPVPPDGLHLLQVETVRQPRIPRGNVRTGMDQVANRDIRVTIAEDGTLTLDDLRTRMTTRGLFRLTSEVDLGDTYTCSPPPPGTGRWIAVEQGPLSTRVLASGPLAGVLESRWMVRLPGHGAIGCRLLVTVLDGEPLVRLRLDLDNQAVNHRLRVWFPTGLPGRAIAGLQVGQEERSPGATERTALETIEPTFPAHRFVAASRGTRGLGVLMPGFFEAEWTEGGEIGVTVLRAVGQLSRGGLTARPGHAGWPTPIPEAQCLGPQHLACVVAPLREPELRPRGLDRIWEQAMLPVRTMWMPR